MTPLYENEMYVVLLTEDRTQYRIINKQTGVEEGVTNSMPDALTTAMMSEKMVKAVLEQDDTSDLPDMLHS